MEECEYSIANVFRLPSMLNFFHDLLFVLLSACDAVDSPSIAEISAPKPQADSDINAKISLADMGSFT